MSTPAQFSRANRRSRREGFTLTELMIVVSIIGLLGVIAIPLFSKARDTARLNSIYSNLRQLEGAKEQWALEKGKITGALVEDVSVLAPYLRGGKIEDVMHEYYVPNAVGTRSGASLPRGVALAPYPAGGFIPAP